MNQKKLAGINKYLLLSILGLGMLIIFLVDYFGFGRTFSTTIIIVSGVGMILYKVGYNSPNNLIRRSANLLICGITATVTFGVAYIGLQTSMAGDDLIGMTLIVGFYFSFFVYSLFNTIRYWNESHPEIKEK